MNWRLQKRVTCCCLIGFLLQKTQLQAAPIVRMTQQESRLGWQREQLRRLLVDVSRLDLNIFVPKDLGWFIADFQPSYRGSPVVEEQGITRNGVSYAVPNSQTKPLLKGKYKVLASFGTVSQADGSYRMESHIPNFRMGDPRDYYEVDGDPLLWGGATLMRMSEEPNQPMLPVIAVPKEWVSDVKTAVERRQQDPTQGQLEGKSAEQLLEMLSLAPPVESFPILKALLPQISGIDEKQRDAIREVFFQARGLKRAVWLTQILQNQFAFSLNKPSAASLNPVFDKDLAEKIAADVPIEDAISLLAALQVGGIRGDLRGNISDLPAFGFDLLRALATQTRFQTSLNQLQSDEQKQIRTLLSEMGVAGLAKSLPTTTTP